MGGGSKGERTDASFISEGTDLFYSPYFRRDGPFLQPAIQFTGTAPGTYSGRLEITSSDPDENPYRIPLLAVVAGSAATPPTYASAPVIVPATATTGAMFSATITGTPNASVSLEASTDLGQLDPWETLHTLQLDTNGAATFNHIADPGSTGASRNFWRLQY